MAGVVSQSLCAGYRPQRYGILCSEWWRR